MHNTFFRKYNYFDTYWTYMIQFAEKCVNENTPNFTLECSQKVYNPIIVNNYLYCYFINILLIF